MVAVESGGCDNLIRLHEYIVVEHCSWSYDMMGVVIFTLSGCLI